MVKDKVKIPDLQRMISKKFGDAIYFEKDVQIDQKPFKINKDDNKINIKDV